MWCRKNVTKKCIRTSESSRVGARRSRVTASTRNNPACYHLSTTSALGRLLTPGAASATLLLRALLEQLLFQDISHSQSASDCVTCVETRPRNEDAPAATCLNFYASRSFCFKSYTRQMRKANEMISGHQQQACPRALRHPP